MGVADGEMETAVGGRVGGIGVDEGSTVGVVIVDRLHAASKLASIMNIKTDLLRIRFSGESEWILFLRSNRDGAYP
jgi:hypothetical protein